MNSRVIYSSEGVNGITEAIFFVDGHYIYEPQVKLSEIVGQRNNECIYRYWVNPQRQYLYNGRVELRYQIYLFVDGIQILSETIDKNAKRSLRDCLSYSLVTK